MNCCRCSLSGSLIRHPSIDSKKPASFAYSAALPVDHSLNPLPVLLDNVAGRCWFAFAHPQDELVGQFVQRFERLVRRLRRIAISVNFLFAMTGNLGASAFLLYQSISCTTLLRVARFPRIGLVDARPFSCPLLEEFSSSRCMSNTDTYFHKRLDHCTTETWVPLNLQYFPSQKGTIRRSGWHRPCWIFLYGLDLPTLRRAIRRFAVSGQKRRVRRRLPGPHRLSRLLRASAGTRIAYRGNRCSV